MGLKDHDPGRQAPVLGLVFEQSEHGLVTAVHAVKVANGQRAGPGQFRVVETAENSHGGDYRFCQARAGQRWVKHTLSRAVRHFALY
jgi:hypothetical protein